MVHLVYLLYIVNVCHSIVIYSETSQERVCHLDTVPSRISTVLVIIKLTKFPVPLQFQWIEMLSLYHNVLRYLRTLNKVWSLVRRRLLGDSPGTKLCATFLNIAKYSKTVRCGCGAVVVIFSIYLKAVL